MSRPFWDYSLVLFECKMKKILFAFATMIILAACGNKQTLAPAEGDEVNNEVAFEVAKIILDKKYADKTIVMVNEQVKDYYAAIDCYLAEQIAGHYAKGEYSVPVYQEVAVNADDSTNIRIWGDFWVYNYKQEGDTLKCVSGGSHPGLMHICQMGEYFYVSAFEQVEDGSRFLPSAKRIFGEYFEAFQIHHSDGDEHESLRHDVLRAFVRDRKLSATKYQDYGWPAKDLDL